MSSSNVSRVLQPAIMLLISEMGRSHLLSTMCLTAVEQGWRLLNAEGNTERLFFSGWSPSAWYVVRVGTWRKAHWIPCRMLALGSLTLLATSCLEFKKMTLSSRGKPWYPESCARVWMIDSRYETSRGLYFILGSSIVRLSRRGE